MIENVIIRRNGKDRIGAKLDLGQPDNRDKGNISKPGGFRERKEQALCPSF